MTPQTYRVLALAPLALLCLVTGATANHFTCNWGGPGNDPAAHGWNYFCTGYQSNQDGFTCDYICELTFRYAYVATFGKIDHSDGIIEFNTACNKNGFAPENFCGPSFWGICLGDKAPYSKCWYQQSYDDCQFPEWINRTHMPDKVTIYYISHSLVDERVAASAPRSAAIEGAQDHQNQAQSLTVGDRSPSPPQGAAINRGEADAAEAPSVLRVKARSLGSKEPAAREAEGEKDNAPRTTARSAWAKVSNAWRAFTGENLLEEDEEIVRQESEKGH